LCKQLSARSCYCSSTGGNLILVDVLRISLAKCILFHSHAPAEEFWCPHLQSFLTLGYRL
jgi:hypothetical protein